MEQKDYYSIKAISASSLKWFEVSPLYFRKMLDKEIEQISQKYFEFGTQVHMKLLEPERFDKEYCTLDFKTPTSEQQKQFCLDYLQYPAKKIEDKAIYAYKQSYVSKESDDKIKEKAVKLKEQLHNYIQYLKRRTEFKDILSKSVWESLNDIKNTVHNHIKANELLTNTDNKDIFYANEFEIMWEYPKLGLPCKSAIDRLVIDHTNKIIKLVDIKTTQYLHEFKEHFEDLKYYRQLAYYWMAIAWYFKNELKIDNFDEYTHETYIIAIQKKDTTECKVFSINEKYLNEGLEEIEQLIEKIDWHWKNEQWEYTVDYYKGTYIEVL